MTEPRPAWLSYALGELARLGGLLPTQVEEGCGYGAPGALTIRPCADPDAVGLLELRRVEAAELADWPDRLLSLHPVDGAPPTGEALYRDAGGRSWISRDGDGVHCAVDFPADAWYLLGQREEVLHPERRDAHGRLSRAVSRTPDPVFERPWLELWGAFLRRALALAGPTVHFDRHPDGAEWSLALTHDVDSLSERSPGRALRLLAAGMLKLSAERLRAGRRMLKLLGRPDRHRCLERCRAADAPARGTYFVHPGRRGPHDPAYKLRRRRKELRELLSSGQELGHHYGYATAGDAAALGAELAELRRLTGSPDFGGRAHYLRLRGPGDLAVAARVGLVYDAGLGFADEPGYRSACGGPYRPWDYGSSTALGLFELPLTVMDGALFRRYGDEVPDVEECWRRLLTILKAGRRAGACVSLLWHQRVFGPAYPGWAEPYHRALAWARDHGARLGPAGEFVARARALEGLRLVEGRLINGADRPLTVYRSDRPAAAIPLEPGEAVDVA